MMIMMSNCAALRFPQRHYLKTAKSSINLLLFYVQHQQLVPNHDGDTDHTCAGGNHPERTAIFAEHGEADSLARRTAKVRGGAR